LEAFDNGIVAVMNFVLSEDALKIRCKSRLEDTLDIVTNHLDDWFRDSCLVMSGEDHMVLKVVETDESERQKTMTQDTEHTMALTLNPNV
jgi:hypothetical protein